MPEDQVTTSLGASGGISILGDGGGERAADLVPPAGPTKTPLPKETDAGTESSAFVYAIGRVQPRFPSLGLEKEYAQVVSVSDTSGKTDSESMVEVLTRRESRYLARQLCWIFAVEGIETYILHPRDPADFELLVGSLRPTPSPSEIDVVVGFRLGIAPPDTCGGLALPVVAMDQLYSFDQKSFIDAIPRPASIDEASEQSFRHSASELFSRVAQIADNAGATDEHRALNYLAVRYPEIYALIAERHANNASLSSVEVRPSRLSGARAIVDVIFTYVDRRTGVAEQSFVRVDVTEEFPYLVSKLEPYFSR